MTMNQSRTARAVTTPEDPGRVTIADLRSIADISSLLLSLNDPRVGADVLARHIEKIPVLKARVARQFVRRHANRTIPDIAQQIALLGNAQFETILLELLEDIVTLNSEVAPVKAAR
jgi:hypothetical protein